MLSELSRIIRETPDFGSCLPVSRLESEISLIINEVCHFLQTWHSNHKILNIWHCLSYFTANLERFLTNSGLLSCKLSNNVASYELFYGVLRRSKSTIAFCTKDIMCHAIWCHLSSLPYYIWSCGGLTALTMTRAFNGVKTRLRWWSPPTVWLYIRELE